MASEHDVVTVKVVRDAKTGRFTQPKNATKRPSTTVTETIQRRRFTRPEKAAKA